MNLRNVTIWMTGLMMIVMIAVLVMVFVILAKVPEVNAAILFWLASGTPLLVSYFVARNLQYVIPTLILLFSTIAYGIAYAWVLYLAFFIDGMMLILLLYIGVASLSVMIPAWTTAIVIELRHRKKKTEP